MRAWPETFHLGPCEPLSSSTAALRQQREIDSALIYEDKGQRFPEHACSLNLQEVLRTTHGTVGGTTRSVGSYRTAGGCPIPVPELKVTDGSGQTPYGAIGLNLPVCLNGISKTDPASARDA
jgi:hypothetical protein